MVKPHAWDLLSPLIGDTTETLPVVLPCGTEMLALHCMDIIDCYDFDRMVIEYYDADEGEEPEVREIKQYAFLEDQIRGHHFFRASVPEGRDVGLSIFDMPYISEELKNLIESNLEGFTYFYPIYQCKDDPEATEPHPLIPWPRLGELKERYAPDWSREKEPETPRDEFIASFDKHIGPHVGSRQEIVPGDPPIELLFFKACDVHDTPVNLVVTYGLSEQPQPNSGEFVELMLALPSDWDLSDEGLKKEENYWPLRWLKTVAQMPAATGAELAYGSTFQNGDPAEPLNKDAQAGQPAYTGSLVFAPFMGGGFFAEVPIPSVKKDVSVRSVVMLYPEEMPMIRHLLEVDEISEFLSVVMATSVEGAAIFEEDVDFPPIQSVCELVHQQREPMTVLYDYFYADGTPSGLKDLYDDDEE